MCKHVRHHIINASRFAICADLQYYSSAECFVQLLCAVDATAPLHITYVLYICIYTFTCAMYQWCGCCFACWWKNNDDAIIGMANKTRFMGQTRKDRMLCAHRRSNRLTARHKASRCTLDIARKQCTKLHTECVQLGFFLVQCRAIGMLWREVFVLRNAKIFAERFSAITKILIFVVDRLCCYSSILKRIRLKLCSCFFGCAARMQIVLGICCAAFDCKWFEY